MHPGRRRLLGAMGALGAPGAIGRFEAFGSLRTVGMLGSLPLAAPGSAAPTAAPTAALSGALPGATAGAMAGASSAAAAANAGVRRGRMLAFPRDHGAHLETRTEWWYVTGWLGRLAAPTHGFQLTFFRSRTGLADGNESRFAARQLLFAHAAVTQLKGGLHLHDQRIARWSGDPQTAGDRAQVDTGDVRLGGWSLRDDGRLWQARVGGSGSGSEFDLALELVRTQPLLLQGEAGWSRKGPLENQASHYVSEPQLAVQARGTLRGAPVADAGRAWMDHEWSDEYLAPGAVGWDWIGFNLFDGSALTAFVLRRADGSALWAGGSFRSAGQPGQSFANGAVRFAPGRRWRSPASSAVYPVQWQVDTPAGRFEVRALQDAQELDSRASTGTIYWEGLSELLDAGGRRVGLGYLEMTGYASALKM
jgi:predicted secreted hydrolase